FYRSDHFPFARAGVPALSFKSGLDFVGRPEGWGKQQEDEYNGHRYHQPSDEYAPGFRYDGTAQQVRVALRVALAVANAPQLPRWLPSSEFHRQRSSAAVGGRAGSCIQRAPSTSTPTNALRPP